MRLALASAVALVAVAGCGGTKTATQTVTVTRTVTTPAAKPATTTAAAAAACKAEALRGTFDVVPGSAGAGQISYLLRLENTGDAACSVSGLPDAVLIDEQGGALPTNVQPSGRAPARTVVVPAGGAAKAEARFSPDVPGGSEPTDAPCQPRAFTLHLDLGGGSVDAPVQPPTPVCERGSLFFDGFSPAS